MLNSKRTKYLFIIILIFFCVALVLILNMIKNNHQIYNNNSIQLNESSSQTSKPLPSDTDKNTSASGNLKQVKSMTTFDYKFTVNKAYTSKEGKYLINLYDNSVILDESNNILSDHVFLYLSLTVKNLSNETRIFSLNNQTLGVYLNSDTIPTDISTSIDMFEMVGADINLDNVKNIREIYHTEMAPNEILDTTIVFAIDNEYLENDLYIRCLPHGIPEESITEDGSLIRLPVPQIFISDIINKN